MEITVTDMTEDRRHQPVRGDIALSLNNTLRQPRDRNAHIGRNRLCTRAQRAAGPIRIVARLPEPRSIFGVDRPFERTAPEIACDFAEACRLLGYPRWRAVEFHEKHRHFRQ